MPSRSNNAFAKLLGKLLLDIFKALPPKIQGMIVLVIVTLGGSVGLVNLLKPSPVAPSPPIISTPEFDPQDPERTCRWIVALSSKTREVAKSVASFKGSNPLRTDRDAELEKAQGAYSAAIQTKVGTRILWPVIVDRIAHDEVRVKLSFDEVVHNEIRAKVYMRFEEFPQGREVFSIDGKLKVGSSITLEEAKQLDQGGWVFIDGVIDTIRADIPSSSDSVSIDVKGCRAVLAAPVSAIKP